MYVGMSLSGPGIYHDPNFATTIDNRLQPCEGETCCLDHLENLIGF